MGKDNYLKDRTGEINEVIQAKIVVYRNAHDIDVVFLDTNTLVEHKAYKSFKNNEIRDPKKTAPTKRVDRLGEEKENKYGELMKIVAYRSSQDIDVCINEELLEHKDYRYFDNGDLHSSNFKPSLKSKEGEEYVFADGTKMKIIKYLRSDNISVEFSDGTVVKKCCYANFLIGQIRNPNKMKNMRVGEAKKNNAGYEMKIVSYRQYNKIDVMFLCDGSIVEHVKLNHFTTGKLAHPLFSKRKENQRTSRVGEERLNSQGLRLKIIRYHNAADLDVFVVDTHEIITKRNYRDFITGGIFSQNFEVSQKLNQQVMMNNGLYAKLITYRNSKDVDYEFEDGTIVKNKHSRYLKTGGLGHPKLSLIYKNIFCGFETMLAWKEEDAVYYKARCLSCMKESTILTPQQMLHHKCSESSFGYTNMKYLKISI